MTRRRDFRKITPPDLDDEEAIVHEHPHDHPPGSWKHGSHDVQAPDHRHYHSRRAGGDYDHHEP
jgi:hypothetical protein